jgi:hypothetical protein
MRGNGSGWGIMCLTRLAGPGLPHLERVCEELRSLDGAGLHIGIVLMPPGESGKSRERNRPDQTIWNALSLCQWASKANARHGNSTHH